MQVPKHTPLKNSFRIAKEYRSKDISFLLELIDSSDIYNPAYKLVNLLRRNGFNTIEDILNSDPKRIQLIKHVGEKSINQLLAILKILSDKDIN